MRALSLSLGLIAPVFLSGLTLQAPAAAQSGFAVIANPTERAIGLTRSLPVRVGVQTANGRIYAILESAILLELKWHSVRSSKYRLLVQQADGSLAQQKPEPVRTLRGHVVGMPGTAVAASLVRGGITARIRTAKGQDYWLQPAPVAGLMAGEGRHVLYRKEDVIKSQHKCGVTPKPFRVEARAGGSTAPMESTAAAELACDADYEYFKDYGSNASNVMSRIESVINSMNLQYERDVGITHAITAIVVRTNKKQPYKSSDAYTLLTQFRREWNSKQAGISRDVAQLFTGKEVGGNTIGIAWIGTVCNLSYAYSVVQSDFNGNFASATDLSAHELGHSWSADHCSCAGYTMNPYITSANRFHGTYTVPEITGFRDTRSCLGGGGTTTPITVSASVTASTQGVGKGQKRGRAVVLVTDNLGQPVSGANVTGSFSGTLNEDPPAATTGGDGTVTFQTTATANGKVSVTFCVTNVDAAPLTWSQSEVCDSN